MKVSVIIPTFKPGDYLFACLHSLFKQTMKPSDFEILLILNGCSEPYYSNIKNYILRNNFSNLKLIRTDEKGVSAARNIGLEHSQGDYVCFIDDDDYVSTTYLEDLYSTVSPDSISICPLKCFKDGAEMELYDDYITKNYNYLVENRNGRITLLSARHYFSNPVCKLIPIEVARKGSFNSSVSIGEDGLYFFKISPYIKNIELAPKSAVYYRRIRENSSSRHVDHKSKIKKLFSLLWQYLISWFKSPFRYNVIFLMTRLAAVIFSIAVNFKNFLVAYLSNMNAHAL